MEERPVFISLTIHNRGREGLRRFLHTSSHMHGRVLWRREIQLMRRLINLKLWITLAQVWRKEIPRRIGKQMIGLTQALLVGAIKGHVPQFAHQRAAPLAWRDPTDKHESRCTLFKLKFPLISVQVRIACVEDNNPTNWLNSLQRRSYTFWKSGCLIF